MYLSDRLHNGIGYSGGYLSLLCKEPTEGLGRFIFISSEHHELLHRALHTWLGVVGGTGAVGLGSELCCPQPHLARFMICSVQCDDAIRTSKYGIKVAIC